MSVARVYNQVTKHRENFWNNIHFHPTDAIEDEWGQRILKEVSKDHVAKTVRMYAMLEDIVTADSEGNYLYDFTLNDQRLDFLLEQGFSPLISYSFIPPCLAEQTELTSAVSKGKTRYKGKMIIASRPTDYSRWGEICYEYTKHIVERYGIEKVSTWYLQCYNEPDGGGFFMKNAQSYPERMREYYKLYTAFAEGVKKVDSRLRIGGPVTTDYVIDALDNFLRYVKQKNLPLDFISAHSYGTSPGGLNSKSRLLNVYNNIGTLHIYCDLVKKYFPEGKELVVDEWGAASAGFYNVEECPSLIFRETSIFSAYFAKMVTYMIENNIAVDKLIICLSGQHEMTSDFSGFRNFFTLHFIKKPIYNAFSLMSHLKADILRSETENTDLSILATKEGEQYAVLLTYASQYFESATSDFCVYGTQVPKIKDTVEIEGVYGQKHITLWQIDETHTNPYAVYQRNGYTGDLTEAQIAELKEEGILKPIKILDTVADGTVKISFELSPNGILLIEF